MADPPAQTQQGGESKFTETSAAKIYVMPEQFLAVTRGPGLPIGKAPPPPVAVPPLGVRGGKGELPPDRNPSPTSAKATAGRHPPLTPRGGESPPPPLDRGDLKVAATPPAPSAPPGPGIPMEEGKRKMIMIWGGVAAVILIGGGLAAFFALRSVKPSAPPAPANTAPANVPAPTNIPPANIAPPAPEPEPEPEPAPTADRDTDSDGLTDAEEILLGTDIGLADTDRDGYADALELANLYNPAGIAPQRLLDAGLVYEYEHPTQGWSIYLPRQWTIAATDQEQKELVVTTQATGEEIVVKITEGEAGVGPHDASLGVQPLETKRGASGIAKRDVVSNAMTEAVFPLGETLALTIAHRVARPPARYPHLFEMLVQSFAVSPS